MLVLKVKLGINALAGFLYKILVDMHILKVPELKPRNNDNIVVSLTSYGRRVRTNVVYYTLVSLLRQSEQPFKILLWLAEDEWNDDILPPKISSLRKKGIEIHYCKDIKSYKKLIPTLKKYPKMNIITVDDDMIYSKHLIKSLIDEHLNNPNDIICTAARKPIIDNGIPTDYSKWEDSLLKPFANGFYGELLFPVGVGGILYPPDSLHEDVTNENLFMNYCPKADDIWFWFCGLRTKKIKRYVIKKGYNLSFDSLYQYLHSGSALTHSNNNQNQNDEQIKRLFDYYHYKL